MANSGTVRRRVAKKIGSKVWNKYPEKHISPILPPCFTYLKRGKVVNGCGSKCVCTERVTGFNMMQSWIYANNLCCRRASYLNGAVVFAGRVTAHVAGVAAARAALHLHTRRPYQEVGRRGIHLAPGDLVDHRPCLADCWNCLLYCNRDEREGGERESRVNDFGLRRHLLSSFPSRCTVVICPVRSQLLHAFFRCSLFDESFDVGAVCLG